MKIGLNTDSLGALSLEETLDAAAELGLDTVEFGLGGWSSAPHVDIAELLGSEAARDRLTGMLRERGLAISALNASGNPLHPGEIGPADAKLAHDAVALAKLLGVSRVIMMSGLPGGGPEEKTPNWITSSWPLEAMEMLEWQWTERVIPFWRELAKAGEAAGVRFCVENHGRQCVYNPESYFRLREAIGPAVGMNFDPSHLIWMGGDSVAAIEALGTEHIYHFHGKDTRIEPEARVNGTLDVKHVTPVVGRTWNFVPLGHGLSRRGWLEVVMALRRAGYDDVISIENEDYTLETRAAIEESVQTLRFAIAESGRRLGL
ncbi:sugar phosphate isomerase/epimerase family protein [Amaricoccus solimangrovi]|uniref:Sugar phosphate isomerase/epimerase n=1 Tax=Amaricoccus solimangrovi TaxID=2589815 RepID=A0A501WTW2_9RHOB|nr:sugar phosphate isomerase/epimerase [Amaricoccus solimangrovi]TPE49276.1 sugar phosphate isomerase/epimerase [Amaricoccus solimangrovi]